MTSPTNNHILLRLSRERAQARLVPGAAQDRLVPEAAQDSLVPGAAKDLTDLWKEEWAKIYPDMNAASAWKQIIGRYQYHFGAAELR